MIIIPEEENVILGRAAMAWPTLWGQSLIDMQAPRATAEGPGRFSSFQ